MISICYFSKLELNSLTATQKIIGLGTLHASKQGQRMPKPKKKKRKSGEFNLGLGLSS